MVRPVKIYKGETPIEELQQAFRDEMADILKNAALRMGCPVEQLKCRFDNLGRVEVQMMPEEEMNEMELQRRKQKLKKTILEGKNRG